MESASSGGGTIPDEEIARILQIAQMNEKENERRAEKERLRQRQVEQEHKNFIYWDEQRKKKERQRQQELLDGLAKSSINGNPLFCSGCRTRLLTVPCPLCHILTFQYSLNELYTIRFTD
jgi:hypothetical protein